MIDWDEVFRMRIWWYCGWIWGVVMCNSCDRGEYNTLQVSVKVDCCVISNLIAR